MNTTDYTTLLAEEDKMRVRFSLSRGRIVFFVVQYHALINTRWKTILRVDACHGELHRHVYHLHDKEYRLRLSNGDLGESFTETLGYIRNNYAKIKQNYLLTQPKRTRQTL